MAGTFTEDPLPPTEREVILVARNNGLRPWLEHAFARRHGCAAALDFRSPLALSTTLARQFVPATRLADDGGRPDASPFDAEVLLWRLADLLREITFIPEDGAPGPEDEVTAPLRAYLDATGSVMPLAGRLASLFDNYQAYRPDLLAAWLRDEQPLPNTAHADWQAALWRRLHTGASVPDRAAGLEMLIDHLTERAPSSRGLPRRLSVFGARLFPPLYYRVLDAVARHVPVTLYAVTAGLPDNPYDNDFLQDGFTHPLLRALGEHTRDYAHVLRDLGAPPLDRVASPGNETPDDTALGVIQRALIRDDAPALTPLSETDRSVRVIDAHSPRRELEVLRDHLLHAFETLPDLRPSDVLVMVPDLDRYAPLIDAVFSAEETAGVRLPVHVAEHPHAPALRVLEACSTALRLLDGRVTGSSLLDLLDRPAVARRAGIREEELPTLRSWLREAGVRWGLDGARKAAFGLPEDDLHTWRFGLDRLLLGYAAGTVEKDGTEGTAALTLGRLPCDAAGLDGADLLGRFAEWAQRLVDGLRELSHPRPLAKWPAAVTDFVEALFEVQDEEEVEAVLFLREQAAELARLDRLAQRHGGAVPFEAVRAHLESRTAAFERREPYLTGRITFARPFPLHHTPHRVIAMVGLGDGVYPEPETRPGFDLIMQHPRPGDAMPRRAEKQLFLDAVLAARDRLVLSYVGRDDRDNRERAASVVLDAFLDACEQHFGPGVRERLVERHRLQPFSASYFTGDGPTPEHPLFSYAAQHAVRPDRRREAAQPFFTTRLATPKREAEVTLREVAQVWTSPATHVLKRRLGLALDLDEHALEDDEPVTLDGLQSYHVRDAILNGLIDGMSEGTIAERLRASGLLPAGAPGQAWLRKTLDTIRPLAAWVRSCGDASPCPLALTVHDTPLVGTAERVTARGGLHVRAGSIRPKDQVAAWVEHLARNAASEAGDPPERARATICAGVPKGVLAALRFDPLPPEQAHLLLQSLVRCADAIQAALPPLFERASYAYAEKVSDPVLRDCTQRILDKEFAVMSGTTYTAESNLDVHDWAFKKASEAFDSSWGDTYTDRRDAHVALATRGDSPFDADAPPEKKRLFVRWSLLLWAPLMHHRAEHTIIAGAEPEDAAA